MDDLYVAIIEDAEQMMNVKYLIPFIEAAHEVILAEAQCQLQRGQLMLEKAPYRSEEITVILSLVGDVKGTVFYGMPFETALKVVSVILGEVLTEFDPLAQSGIAELGNVITGRASVKLSQAGYETTISPPTLMIGKNASISTLDMPRLVVPLVGDIGKITIQLALMESSQRGANAGQLPVPQAPKPI